MDEKNFGDFEEIVDEKKENAKASFTAVQGENNIPIRVRIPRRTEVIGKITQRYGGNRMEVQATDGKTRNCRVPGRYRRALWLRPNDFVIVMPWPDSEDKGDIIYKYSPGEVSQLRKRGMVQGIKEGF